MGTLQTNISHPFSFEGDMFVAAEPNASEALFWLSYIALYQFFSLLRTESEDLVPALRPRQKLTPESPAGERVIQCPALTKTLNKYRNASSETCRRYRAPQQKAITDWTVFSRYWPGCILLF